MCVPVIRYAKLSITVTKPANAAETGKLRFKNNWLHCERSSKRDMKTWQQCHMVFRRYWFGLPRKTQRPFADETLSEHDPEFARTTDSRSRQISSSHDEILEIKQTSSQTGNREPSNL